MRRPLQGRHGYGPRRSPPRRPAGPFQLPQHRRERLPPPAKEKPPVQELIIPRGPKIISTKKKEEEKKQEEETEKKEENANEGTGIKLGGDNGEIVALGVERNFALNVTQGEVGVTLKKNYFF